MSLMILFILGIFVILLFSMDAYSDSKDCYMVTKTILFQINAVYALFLFINESSKQVS